MPRALKRHRIVPLGSALDAWEDFWLWSELLYHFATARTRIAPFTWEQALVNYPRFRRFLLSLHGQAAGAFSVDAFRPPRDYPGAGDIVLLGLPVALSSWMLHSRRVFNVGEELQAVLGATSLEGVKWEDLKLPFPSFGISLARPFRDIQGDEYDFILVTSFVNSLTGKPGFSMQAFATTCSDYVPIRTREKELYKRYIERKQWKLLQEAGRNWRDRAKSVTGFGVVLDRSVHGEELVLETAGRDFREKEAGPQGPVPRGYGLQDAEQIIRLVCGLALYLRTLPPGSPHLSDPTRTPVHCGQPDNLRVFTEADVMSVSSRFQLTRGERIMVGLDEPGPDDPPRAPFEMCWHFRAEHDRRLPGQGNDPDAPRPVRVRGAIVRKDQASDPGAPGGTLVNL